MSAVRLLLSANSTASDPEVTLRNSRSKARFNSDKQLSLVFSLVLPKKIVSEFASQSTAVSLILK